MKMRFIKLFTVLIALLLAVNPAPFGLSAGANATFYEDEDEYEADIYEEQYAGPVSSSIYSYSSIKSAINRYAADNRDVKGWLVIPNTNINVPIAYSSKDNDYYVNRDIKGVNYPTNSYPNFFETASYLDCRTVFGTSWSRSSRNTVIYGHNWTNLKMPHDVGAKNNHAMFAQLPSYTDINFAKTNSHIYFSTGQNEGIWRVFCVAFVELSNKFNYNNPNPATEDYATLLKELKARSVYNFDVDVTTDDRILTLSTCTRQYNVGANQRFIVVARLLREGESEKDSVGVAKNNNVKAPQFS